MSVLKKFSIWHKSSIERIKERTNDGKRWIGTGGLIKMESSALLTLFFMTLLPIPVSMILSAAIVVAKSIYDRKQGNDNEMHDLICAVIGIVFGVVLGVGISASIISW